ncbi:Acetolactate synthase [Candidatus Nitrosocosmicus oleophilus]|jgi:acetolactate synthase I/II/III large subunit|uniref:Acetolactate synthase n=1 Tax=Candidatus Nitrosocosmicus oleophilus TaxID=1353260 RepID=A0A654M3I4_9ARCH|nr:acetolactate synthase large subunit [Candidatus Nitrosocosmicus oleophilus]ALI37196.1 Acetolactate synthase [Candidatus Nitrosocosmicus oleophilus]
MKASDLFVKCLEAENVEYIFGIPGEETNDLTISISESETIKFILARHEQAAAFMADVYGRLTNKVGVCLATLGPGATNLTTGVASANMDRSPLLAITGQTEITKMHKESHQNMDPVTMFTPITKWTWSIRDADGIPEILRRAFKIAAEEKKGATHLDLPVDVAKMESLLQPLSRKSGIVSGPTRSTLHGASKMILNSNAPVILVGNGCIRNNASNIIRRFANLTGFYSMNTFMGKGVISDNSPTHMGTIGIKESDYALHALKLADVVISIGYDLVEYSPKNWNGSNLKKIIHIDSTSAEVDNYYNPDIEISGDLNLTINLLMNSVKRYQNEIQINSINKQEITLAKARFRKIKKEVDWRVEQFMDDESYPIKPEKLIHDVRNVLSSEDILISDVGAHKLWIAKIFKTYSPNTCIISNGFCSMGFALPGAIGAQLACPSRKVVAMCGDGGFLMNVQELETAVRLQLPIIVVVWCDSDLGVISTKQRLEFGRNVFTNFNNPDFVKLAESFGAKGYRVTSTDEFSYVLREATKSLHIPVVIAIDIDADRNELLFRSDRFHE